MAASEGRFYPARFVAHWAGRQTEELEGLLEGARSERVVRGEGLPLALGIVANYRMALEHVAQEVARLACPFAHPERVSFPVAEDPVGFRSMMLFRFPGLRPGFPKAWSAIREVQPYRPGNDGWLLYLHRLWNRSLALELGPESLRDEAGPALDLVYLRDRRVVDLLRRAGPAELELIDALDVALRSVRPPPWNVDRRDRR